MSKRIFVGLDFCNSNCYIYGLSSQFELVFAKKYALHELAALRIFLLSLKNVCLIYRVPLYRCYFQVFYEKLSLSYENISLKARRKNFRHAVFASGLVQEYFQYVVAYIAEDYLQEQLELIGVCAPLVNVIEIDCCALWTLRWQENPQLGQIKEIRFLRSAVNYSLFGREADFWHTTSHVADVVEKITDEPWLIAKALAVRGYYYAL